MPPPDKNQYQFQYRNRDRDHPPPSEDSEPEQIISTSSGEGESFVAEPTPTTTSTSTSTAPTWLPAKSGLHFVAGGLGGLCGAVVTAPFDVVKTRLQSDLFSVRKGEGEVVKGLGGLLRNFVDTGFILRNIHRNEGFTALFTGLGPTLVGVIPARSINFFTYGNGKQIYANLLNDGNENATIHLLAAATAGVVTATATNPIWVVKTRLQLQQASTTTTTSPLPPTYQFQQSAPTPTPKFRPFPPHPHPHPHPTTPSLPPFSPSFRLSSTLPSSSSPSTLIPKLATATATATARTTTATTAPTTKVLDLMSHIWKTEGVRGYYKGLSASLLGVTEGTIQWTLYERFKIWSRPRPSDSHYDPSASASRRGKRDPTTTVEESWTSKIISAGSAKLIATLITYPHEVIRTRLRQTPSSPTERPRYTGLWQTFALVLREEGVRSLYGGLSAHLMRVIPNAAVMYGIYEVVLKWGDV